MRTIPEYHKMFSDHLAAYTVSAVPENLYAPVNYILSLGGKRIRPMFLMLCYDMLGGKNLDEVLPLATAYEIIHTATLIHDDINDNAKIRRGVKTIHEIENSVKAQITGDWLFVLGFGLGGQYEKEIVDLMAETCSRMASAELKQLEHIHNLSTTSDDYYKMMNLHYLNLRDFCNKKDYCHDISKIINLGWKPKTSFDEGLNLTITKKYDQPKQSQEEKRFYRTS